MKSKASLFLIELMISTLFFALAATVCVQMFVKAHFIDEENAIKAQATLILQNMGENWTASPDSLESTMQYMDVNGDETRYINYYSKDWTLVSESEAAFAATMICGEDDSFYYAEVSVNEFVDEAEVSAKEYTEDAGVQLTSNTESRSERPSTIICSQELRMYKPMTLGGAHE